MYTIVRKRIGMPDYFNIYLCEVEDCFLFETEYEAYKCLQLCFENGADINDEHYGMCRHFVAEYGGKHGTV